MEENKLKRRFVSIFLFILCLHTVAILIFARGFLLTRTELPLFSECSDSQKSPCRSTSNLYSNEEKAASNSSDRCWAKPSFDKVVIIVLDALRFDFVAPSKFFEADGKPWMDKLQILQKMVMEESSSARIFKAIADPPTTSLQRLKGLTTGGLPTFIDVGNSFGAPAITEDNLIHQLIKNGKRVVMMGDDTWLQVFPNHFHEAHPFPSFNVKDLHTVDNGVVEHIFPYLERNDWDVLIGHFLGVDHAGHIFGVESPQMVQKLEQYNNVLEAVVSLLMNRSGPGDLHKNTLLIVMGDHGQTLNGDHGGGTPEEVETSIFAMSTHKDAPLMLSTIDNFLSKKDCRSDICISTIPQLDFAATIAAFLGIPFPFGSVGRVNPELYLIGAGSWSDFGNSPGSNMVGSSGFHSWLKHFTDVLCINSWQVKRYIDTYSKSSIIGFSTSDLIQLENIYGHAHSVYVDGEDDALNSVNVTHIPKFSLMKRKIDAYSQYLEATASLARSKWTQFGLKTMFLGIFLFIISLAVQLTILSIVDPSALILKEVPSSQCGILVSFFSWKCFCQKGFFSVCIAVICFPLLYSVTESIPIIDSISHSVKHILLVSMAAFVFGPAICFLVAVMLEFKKGCKPFLSERKVVPYEWSLSRHVIPVSFILLRACSFLSNSYILVEGTVTSFLLASTGLIVLKRAVTNQSLTLWGFSFLLFNFILDKIGQMGLSKDTLLQAPKSSFLPNFEFLQMEHAFTIISEFMPLMLVLLLSYRCFHSKGLWLNGNSWNRISFVVALSYILISLQWFLGDIKVAMSYNFPKQIEDIARLMLPRLVYILTSGQVIYLFYRGTAKSYCDKSNFAAETMKAVLGMLLAWTSSILLLLGKQGPFIALLAGLQGWCIIQLSSVLQKGKVSDTISVLLWNLFAVQLFFSTGHKCAFDGLHYGAAFIGFDNFNIVQQGILLALDTFGASHILPIFGLPLLVIYRQSKLQNDITRGHFILHLTKILLIYGLMTTMTATLSTLCVMIHRRHLMVWGLFAPKYVFEIVGLLLTDLLVVLSSIYYL